MSNPIPGPEWVQTLTDHPTTSLTLTGLALVTLYLAMTLLRTTLRTLRRTLAGVDRADLLTYVAASIATGVATQGMWNFFGDVLDFPWVLRVGMFAFFEIAVIASAVRARRAMRERGSSGVDGIAVWVLTSGSAVFSAMDADTIPEALFRLAAPLVAAWLWERGMALERQRLTGRAGIHWRLTPERVLVRLGIAEPAGRTAGQVDTERRLTRLALAAKHARRLQQTNASGWRQRRALARLDTAMHHAVTHTGLATDPNQQAHLMAQLAALTNASNLLALTLPAPWATSTAGPTQPPPATFTSRNTSSDARDSIGDLVQARPSDIARLRDVLTAHRSPVPVPSESVPSPVTPAGSVPVPVPSESVPSPVTPAGSVPSSPRPQDVERLRAAIRTGELGSGSSVEEIRTVLKIGRSHARTLRRTLSSEPTTTPTRNPYIDSTETEPAPKHHTREVNSALTKESNPSKPSITNPVSEVKSEEPHTYATPLT